MAELKDSSNEVEGQHEDVEGGGGGEAPSRAGGEEKDKGENIKKKKPDLSLFTSAFGGSHASNSVTKTPLMKMKEKLRELGILGAGLPQTALIQLFQGVSGDVDGALSGRGEGTSKKGGMLGRGKKAKKGENGGGGGGDIGRPREREVSFHTVFKALCFLAIGTKALTPDERTNLQRLTVDFPEIWRVTPSAYMSVKEGEDGKKEKGGGKTGHDQTGDAEGENGGKTKKKGGSKKKKVKKAAKKALAAAVMRGSPTSSPSPFERDHVSVKPLSPMDEHGANHYGGSDSISDAAMPPIDRREGRFDPIAARRQDGPRSFRIDPRRKTKLGRMLDECKTEEERRAEEEKERAAVHAFHLFRHTLIPKRTAPAFRFAQT
uniref:Uncharacterized protein n=1 Tax=Palpitomonas bilix TaxID=652834 RepID=A0A7S3GK21_9EUKA